MTLKSVRIFKYLPLISKKYEVKIDNNQLFHTKHKKFCMLWTIGMRGYSQIIANKTYQRQYNHECVLSLFQIQG